MLLVPAHLTLEVHLLALLGPFSTRLRSELPLDLVRERLLLLSQLFGSLGDAAHRAGGLLLTHATQLVAGFPQLLGRPLTLVFALHVPGGLFEAVDGLFEARILRALLAGHLAEARGG